MRDHGRRERRTGHDERDVGKRQRALRGMPYLFPEVATFFPNVVEFFPEVAAFLADCWPRSPATCAGHWASRFAESRELLAAVQQTN